MKNEKGRNIITEMGRFCEKCGTQLQEGAAFCIKCGARMMGRYAVVGYQLKEGKFEEIFVFDYTSSQVPVPGAAASYDLTYKKKDGMTVEVHREEDVHFEACEEQKDVEAEYGISFGNEIPLYNLMMEYDDMMKYDDVMRYLHRGEF